MQIMAIDHPKHDGTNVIPTMASSLTSVGNTSWPFMKNIIPFAVITIPRNTLTNSFPRFSLSKNEEIMLPTNKFFIQKISRQNDA
jgi:hypothetical protein